MRLATIRTSAGTVAVRLDDDAAVEVGATDLVEFLGDPAWRDRAAAAEGPEHALADLDYAPLVGRPDKIICVGLNYRHHILEMGRELPEHPMLFAKYRSALVGAYDDIVLPSVSQAMDWEAELGVVVGRRVRHADRKEAASAIAGWTVVNDVTGRDWQNRTIQWLQGKTFEATTPVGPWLEVAEVNADDPGTPSWDLSCQVDGETMQQADTADLLFSPVDLVAYAP
ncbi:MAG: fumarylacetoacetate hydrolase family protein, partial [Acidimicrobiales bacterium]